MTKISLLGVLVLASTAYAGGQKGSIGVGAEYELSGVGGASVNYDAGMFHVGGFLSFQDPPGPNNTVYEIGGRFFYHMHTTAMSDFGIGGGLGLESVPNNPGPMGMSNGRQTFMFFEPSFQIRLFLASNVAMSFTGGLSIGVVDASGVLITGQGATGGSVAFDPAAGVGFLGGAGIHYYFF